MEYMESQMQNELERGMLDQEQQFDAHLLAAIKAAALEYDWTPDNVRQFLEKHRDVRQTIAKSIHAHALTLARVEALERAERLRKGPSAAQVEVFQQACERGWQIPSEPPEWDVMHQMATDFLNKDTPA